MAPRRPTYTPPQPANLTAEQMQRGIARLQKRIADLEAFDPRAVPERFHSSVGTLQTAVAQTLDGVFGHDTIERQRYGDASRLDNGPITMGDWGRGEPDFRPYLQEGRASAIALLQQAIAWLQEELDERGDATLVPPQPAVPIPKTSEHSRRVFIVHGRDTGPKNDVARFLKGTGFEPIILHEQASGGRTIIEKVEAYGDVGFAVVLLTPDDHGALVGETLQPRARQNVVLELGYFLGRLTRNRVCVLTAGAVELPSDWAGVVYQSYDPAGAWKVALAKELKEAGYSVDWNLVMTA